MDVKTTAPGPSVTTSRRRSRVPLSDEPSRSCASRSTVAPGVGVPEVDGAAPGVRPRRHQEACSPSGESEGVALVRHALAQSSSPVTASSPTTRGSNSPTATTRPSGLAAALRTASRPAAGAAGPERGRSVTRAPWVCGPGSVRTASTAWSSARSRGSSFREAAASRRASAATAAAWRSRAWAAVSRDDGEEPGDERQHQQRQAEAQQGPQGPVLPVPLGARSSASCARGPAAPHPGARKSRSDGSPRPG